MVFFFFCKEEFWLPQENKIIKKNSWCRKEGQDAKKGRLTAQLTVPNFACLGGMQIFLFSFHLEAALSWKLFFSSSAIFSGHTKRIFSLPPCQRERERERCGPVCLSVCRYMLAKLWNSSFPKTANMYILKKVVDISYVREFVLLLNHYWLTDVMQGCTGF